VKEIKEEFANRKKVGFINPYTPAIIQRATASGKISICQNSSVNVIAAKIILVFSAIIASL
jgi:hypothetical protein